MEDKNGNRTDQYTSDDTYVDAPMTVLINGSSASAAEIFAGAMKRFWRSKDNWNNKLWQGHCPAGFSS